LILALLFITTNVQSNNIDSLLQVEQEFEVHDESSRLESLLLKLFISRTYYINQEYSKSLEYALEAQKIEDEMENKEQKGRVFYRIANAYRWLNEYHKSLDYFDAALKELKKRDEANREVICQSYGGKATVLRSLGKYEEAFENQLEALHYSELLKDQVGISTSLYQLGSLFFYQEQYDKALEYYKKAQIQAIGPGSERMAYACVAALGTTYEHLDSLKKSQEYNMLSYEKAVDMGYKTGIAYSLSNIGSTYLSLGEYEKAYNFMNRSLTLKKELKDKFGEIGNLRSMADLFIKMGKSENAIMYLEEAHLIAKEIGSKPRQIEILNLFSQAYKNLGEHEKALSYIEDFIELKDSVLNEVTLEKMGDLKKNYELEQKESEILLLKKDNQLLEVAQEKDKIYSYLWTVVALSFGVLMLLFISRYKAQKKSSELLKGKNEEINRQNEELQNVNELLSDTNKLLEQNKLKIEEQNKALESSNEDLRNFASVASHDLKEPLRMINSYTSILKRKYEGLFDERAHEFMGYVVDGVSRMEQLINSLLDYSRVSIDGKGVESYKLINLRDVVEVVKSNLRYSIVKSSATINIENPDNFPIIRANQVQIMQLMQNLISNALKFRGESLPIITVGFETQGDTHTFYIKDNGIGISKENQEKIFEMLTRLHTKQEYEGTGIGLATVRKIVERHQGKIWVESEEGKGSTFYFTTPIVKEMPAKIMSPT